MNGMLYWVYYMYHEYHTRSQDIKYDTNPMKSKLLPLFPASIKCLASLILKPQTIG